MNAARSTPRSWGLRIGLVVLGAGAGLLLGELGLRVLYPGHVFLRGAVRDTWDPHHAAQRVFTSHPQLGFVPLLDGQVYNAFGTRLNGYDAADRAGRQRLLFVGDSVTSRGRIMGALQSLAGDAAFEYWNAGVEGYNTAQEVAFYRLYNAALQPDHVILTFHNNDFEITPVAFEDADGRLVVYAPRVPLASYDPTLFGQSALYRLLLAQLVDDDAEINRGTIARDSLAELQALVERPRPDGSRGRLSVVLFPLLLPVAEWPASARKSRQLSLGILASLHLQTFDLLPAMETMLASGVDLQQVPGDAQHPSPEAAAGFAQYLFAAGLFDDAGSTSGAGLPGELPSAGGQPPDGGAR